MIGTVGDDKYGREFIRKLQLNGLDVTSIRRIPNMRMSICFVTIDEHTRENTCVFHPGATAFWQPVHFSTAEDLGGGLQPDLIVAQMEIVVDVVERMISAASFAGMEFCLNAAPANPLSEDVYRHLTHLIMNESEAAIMYGCRRNEVREETWSRIARHYLDLGVKHVVITLSGNGAYCANASTLQEGHCPAYDVPVVDTTGAGNSFIGTYAAMYIQQKQTGEWCIRSAVIRASQAAAIKIQSFKAQEGIPWAEEIDGSLVVHREIK